MSNDARAATQRHEAVETVLEGQKRALEMALHGAPIAAVLEQIAKTVEEQSSNDVLASILLLDEDGHHLRHGAAPSLHRDYNAAIDGIAIGPKVGSCGTAAFTGKTIVVSDIQTDPLWAEFKELAGKHGLRACWSRPILSSEGKVLGTFALYHRVAMTPSERDQFIVELLGNTAALVIEGDKQARDRARAEGQLRAERERQLLRVAAMFEHAPAAIALLRGPEHVFEVTNPKYLEIVGGRQMRGQTVRSALPELAGQGFFELLDGVYRDARPYVGRAQRVMLERRGAVEETFFDFVYQPIPGSEGKTDGILVVAFEVTELVRAKLEIEKALARAEASESSLRQFIDNLPELAWTAQPNGNIDYYNRRWYEYTGTTLEEMQGWGWEKVHDPELLPKVVERWKHSLATGEPFEMEFTLRGKDGVPRWFLTRVAAVRDGGGTIIRWFGTNTNIHEIKAAQALTTAVTEQSRDAQRLLLEMRAAMEKAQRRVAELEEEKK